MISAFIHTPLVANLLFDIIKSHPKMLYNLIIHYPSTKIFFLQKKYHKLFLDNVPNLIKNSKKPGGVYGKQTILYTPPLLFILFVL